MWNWLDVFLGVELPKSKAGVICAEGDVENLCKNLITTYEESESYKADAIHFAKEHDWSVVADSVLKIYVKLVRVQ